MSNTTTAMRTIKHVSNIDAITVNKLYDMHDIPQPKAVKVNSIRDLPMYNDGEIHIDEVHHNAARSTVEHAPDCIVTECINTAYIHINVVQYQS